VPAQRVAEVLAELVGVELAHGRAPVEAHDGLQARGVHEELVGAVEVHVVDLDGRRGAWRSSPASSVTSDL
jgi:hypothetical protein